MRSPLSAITKALPALVVLVSVLLLTGCLEKLQQFLPKPAPREEPVAEKPLTPEEEQMQKTLESADVFAPKPEVEEAPKAVPFELNKSSLVSILLYHDFVPRIPRNEMMVSMPVFRAQLQALKDANIPVISMADVIAWKKGEKNIPEEAVVITLDDGWLGVYEQAFPVLKEFGYPFTLYLYKKYVNSGGRSLTIAQIKEMLEYGAELGSHSLSHQPMAMMKQGKTDEAYKAWLTAEIVDSKKFLEETFGKSCRTFAYPYGNKTEEIVKMTMEAGYEAAVTVNPQKVTWDTPDGTLPRFTQLGDKDTNFKLATNFHGSGGSIADSKFLKTDAVNEQGQKLVELKPEPESLITERRPRIEANLSRLGAIAPDSLSLRVSGFGAVPLEYDPATQTARYQVPQKLRLEECTATLSFKRVEADKAEVVSWKFKIDHKASYIPELPAEPTPATSDASAPLPPKA
jgi:peptidoglycan/xylan/chitin deacetylase (PgdA/CDA1 family)